jgi:cell division protein FtsL
MATTENTIDSKTVRRMLGLSLHTWEDLMLLSLGVAALSAVLVITSTWAVVQLQRHEARESSEKIASLNNETARLRAQNALTLDSLLETVRTGRDSALAIDANRSTTEAMAVAQGFATRGSTSEATRALYIPSKVTRFAGKKFDAVVTSTAIDIGALCGSIRAALKNAGWIEIERSDPTAGLGLLFMDKAAGPALVRINVDPSKDPDLLDAAKALDSALREEDIAAIVKTEADTTNANVIHILVGPKP